jgi:hypothetical protein
MDAEDNQIEAEEPHPKKAIKRGPKEYAQIFGACVPVFGLNLSPSASSADRALSVWGSLLGKFPREEPECHDDGNRIQDDPEIDPVPIGIFRGGGRKLRICHGAILVRVFNNRS